jgi:hypothetical protein
LAFLLHRLLKFFAISVIAALMAARNYAPCELGRSYLLLASWVPQFVFPVAGSIEVYGCPLNASESGESKHYPEFCSE